MIDRCTLENMLKGLGIPDHRVCQAVSILMADHPIFSATGGLLNVKQAQEYLGGVSRWTVHRAVKARELPPTRLGKRILFAKADLDSFIQAHRPRGIRRRSAASVPPRRAQSSAAFLANESKSVCHSQDERGGRAVSFQDLDGTTQTGGE